MLKLNASFSKKVPAEVEFSSKSYHAAIEVELPDGLTQQQLQSKIHDTFELVKESVEAEINGTTQNNNKDSTIPYQNKKESGNKNNNSYATPKQLKYLADLANKKNINLFAYIRDYGLNKIEQLSFEQCSQLINKFKSIKAA